VTLPGSGPSGTPAGSTPRGGSLAFGPFQFDLERKRLVRDGLETPLRLRHLDILAVLASRAGQTVTRDEILQTVWPGQVIDDGSLTKAISELRTSLDAADPDRYIVTIKRLGYRFVTPVTRVERRPADVDVQALLAPYRALVDGRAALESLDRERIAQAVAAFEQGAALHRDDPRFHVGLANACVLQFEATRADADPDVALLTRALEHARVACSLDAQYGEAWATLGFVLERTGSPVDAQAALSRATSLERGNWFHSLRLASASWGEARLRAARRTLALMGDATLARVLAATVFVARQALTEAERELDAGLAVIPQRDPEAQPFSTVAIHWLKGLLCLARGAEVDALAAFESELQFESRGHLYARECCANTWYAIGAVHLRRGDSDAAHAAFQETLARVPRHPMARAGMVLLGTSLDADLESGAPESMEGVLARAFLLARSSDVAAAALVGGALSSAPPGNAGWLIPVEPLLGVQHARDAWKDVLVQLRGRAV
jgi:DNA-binding winged helix-turn-helix (wHTH) protein